MNAAAARALADENRPHNKIEPEHLAYAYEVIRQAATNGRTWVSTSELMSSWGSVWYRGEDLLDHLKNVDGYRVNAAYTLEKNGLQCESYLEW